MQPFDYHRPDTLDDAVRDVADRDTRLLAGGTDLLTLMQAGLEAPARLLDIKRLDDLPAGRRETGHGLALGALTTLSAIEFDPELRRRFSLLCEAAALAATPQLRNRATLAGNLLQRPRCWYFRHPDLDCWLKGGDGCPARNGRNQFHGIFGDGPCHAVHPSDLAPALLALDAEVHLRDGDGRRSMALEAFFQPPTDQRRQETLIGDREILLEVRIPDLPADTRSVYCKAMDRKVWSFALAGVAVALATDAGRISHARVALGGVDSVPRRARSAERSLLGEPATPATFARAAEAALADARPLSGNGYKVPLLERLVQRALQRSVAET